MDSLDEAFGTRDMDQGAFACMELVGTAVGAAADTVVHAVVGPAFVAVDRNTVAAAHQIAVATGTVVALGADLALGAVEVISAVVSAGSELLGMWLEQPQHALVATCPRNPFNVTIMSFGHARYDGTFLTLT